MAVRVIRMPDIGEGIAEVELVAWHVKVGDAVAEDQALADVMTDKANVEIPSPVTGTIAALGGEVGETMAVGSELVRIETAAGEGSAIGRQEHPAAVAPVPVPSQAVASVQATATAPAGIEPTSIAATRAPLRSEASRSDAIVSPAERPIASPSVRRRAWELDVDLAGVRGTGGGGRIMHADLEACAAQRAHVAPPSAVATHALPAPTPTRATSIHPASVPPPTPAQASEVEAIRVIGLRRQIAQKMQESKRRIPHFTYVEEVDVTNLETLRGELNERFGAARGKLSPLAFVMRALVLAVREHPQVNARFDDDAGVLNRYAAVHLGIATETPNGLLVPVLRDAQALDLWQCAGEVARLAGVARSGHATRAELTGSTITITSLGAQGGIVSTPVINHPEVAIVGVNRIAERPAIVNGAIVARKLMNLSSSFDHRVVDGADAARFIQALRGYLEAPAVLLVG